MKDAPDFIMLVDGMTCNHCLNTVKSAIYNIENVENVDVDLASGETKINGENINIDEVVKAIISSGYSVEVIN